MGTLSSYGYTLLALHFLMHIKQPPVLPNLQRMDLPDRSGASKAAPQGPTLLQGHDVYFYDDISRVRSEWHSENKENVASLLMDFFVYFSKEFAYAHEVISVKSPTGSFPKDPVHWTGELCIQDPFALQYNVARPVTKAGLYLIRGEFFRASKILANRSQRASTVLADLCEERDDTINVPDPPRYHNNHYRAWHNSGRGHHGQNNGSHAAHGPQGGLGLTGLNPHGGGYPVTHLYDGPMHRWGRHSGNASGVGGSFAFEAMARGLGKGQNNSMAIVPSQAMLQPLSHSAGLTGKPARGRRPVQSSNSASGSTPGSASVTGSGTSKDKQSSTPTYSSPVPSIEAQSSSPSHLPNRNSLSKVVSNGGEGAPTQVQVQAPAQNSSPQGMSSEAGTNRSLRPHAGSQDRGGTLSRRPGKHVQARRFSDTSTRTPPPTTAMGTRYSQPSSPHQLPAGMMPQLPIGIAGPIPFLSASFVPDSRRPERPGAEALEPTPWVYFPPSTDARASSIPSAYAYDWNTHPAGSLATQQSWPMRHNDRSPSESGASGNGPSTAPPTAPVRGVSSSPVYSNDTEGSPNPTVSTELTALGPEQDLDEGVDEPDKTVGA